jgi:hypothetical protein
LALAESYYSAVAPHDPLSRDGGLYLGLNEIAIKRRGYKHASFPFLRCG